jgi:hypothetical protein
MHTPNLRQISSPMLFLTDISFSATKAECIYLEWTDDENCF